MRHYLAVSVLVGLFLALGASCTRAEGFSTFEGIALQDFMITLCSRNDPSRSSKFAKTRNPPYACAPEDPTIAKQAQQSDEYRVLSSKLDKETGALSKDEISAICRTLLETKCGASINSAD